MVRGMWYDPSSRTFGCHGHRKCDVKCLRGKGAAGKHHPHCGAFEPPEWAERFECPRFIYIKKPIGQWECVSDTLGIIAPLPAGQEDGGYDA